MDAKIEVCITKLADTELTYAALPVPMYDEAQKGYVTTMNHNFSVFGILTNLAADATDRAAATLEALASQSYRTVTPNLYEVSMKIRYTTDSTSQRMIDHIRDGVSFEVGRTFTHIFDYETYRTIRKALAGTATEGWSSTAATFGAVFEKQLASLINADAFKNQ
jgi:hypothetical protein